MAPMLIMSPGSTLARTDYCRHGADADHVARLNPGADGLLPGNGRQPAAN
jgi:hypothetical protein